MHTMRRLPVGKGGRPVWGVVLAGGEGKRLEQASVARYGVPRPKQFCDYGEGRTLLASTIQRARNIVPEERVAVITSRAHRVLAEECLVPYPQVRRVEQPCNRETTAGILLPLLDIMEDCPSARVVIMPSDHHIQDEARFVEVVRTALLALLDDPGAVFLLGAPPDDGGEGFGWIVPNEIPGEAFPRVASFREKPALAEIPDLIAAGALRNTFVMVAHAAAITGMVQEHVPGWYDALAQGPRRPAILDRAYGSLPPSNFSQDVLAPARDRLRVLSLGDVGWDDIGTPARLARAFQPRTDAREAALT